MAERKRKRKIRESFGSVRILPSGRVQASYTGADGNRYNAPHTYDGMTDARGWLATQRARIVDGTWSAHHASASSDAKAKRAETFGEFAANWIANRRNSKGQALKPRTRVEYERLLSGPLEALQAERVGAITPEVVDGWWQTQVATGRETQTARAYGLLKSIMATAVDRGRVASNPCRIRGAQNATTGRKVEPPTTAQLAKIVDTITPRFKAAVLIAAWAGCRYGELTELRRKDLDIVRDGREVVSIVVNVERAVTHTTGVGFVVGGTKSAAGVRSIALPPHIFPVVLDHLKLYTADFPSSLLFPASDGVTHLAQSTFTKHFYPARKAAKRTDLPFHALRHFGATRFALTGATLAEIQSRLGHSTVTAAMRYQHVAGRDAELARRMSEDLASTPDVKKRPRTERSGAAHTER